MSDYPYNVGSLRCGKSLSPSAYLEPHILRATYLLKCICIFPSPNASHAPTIAHRPPSPCSWLTPSSAAVHSRPPIPAMACAEASRPSTVAFPTPPDAPSTLNAAGQAPAALEVLWSRSGETTSSGRSEEAAQSHSPRVRLWVYCMPTAAAPGAKLQGSHPPLDTTLISPPPTLRTGATLALPGNTPNLQPRTTWGAPGAHLSQHRASCVPEVSVLPQSLVVDRGREARMFVLLRCLLPLPCLHNALLVVLDVHVCFVRLMWVSCCPPNLCSTSTSLSPPRAHPQPYSLGPSYFRQWRPPMLMPSTVRLIISMASCLRNQGQSGSTQLWPVVVNPRSGHWSTACEWHAARQAAPAA
jgi:hypothetical protein